MWPNHIVTYYWPQPEGYEDRAWTACYEEDEVDNFGDMPAVGYGPTEERAVCNLFVQFPKQECER